MRKFVLALSSTLFCLLFCSIQSLMAIPAVPWPVEKQQPDGTKITVYIKGDEKLHWMESEDGYTLLYNDRQAVVYAFLNEEGNLAPSDIMYTNTVAKSTPDLLSQKGIVPGLQYSQAQVNTIKQLWKVDQSLTRSDNKAHVLGTKKAVCVLAEFKDKKFIKTVEEFDNLMNQVGYTNNSGANGSVRDFYKENSYGKMDFEITVVGPYELPQNCSYYGPDSRWATFAKAAANASDADVDYTLYANENNQLDNLHIIFAGHGDEAIQDGNQIWSHKSDFYNPLTLDGVKIVSYSCSPELRGGMGTTITSIGVVCHELCHVFGAPDFYDANYNTGGYYEGTGDWDLMAGGSYNYNGHTPAHINMYQKIQFGWVDPIELDSPTSITDMPNSAENPVAYVVYTTNNNNYYVLENRQKVGYDAGVPGAGLLIYHVSITNSNINNNNVNNTHPQRVYPVCASSSHQIPSSSGGPSSYGNISSSGCLFNDSRPALTSETTPAMIYWKSSGLGGSNIGEIYEGKPITNIKVKDELVSFDFMMSADPKINVSHEIKDGYLYAEWTTSNILKQIKEYNIYINGTKVTTVKNSSFSYNLSYLEPNSINEFGVSIVYTDGEESYIETFLVDTTVSIDEVITGKAYVYPNPVTRNDKLTVNLGENESKANLYVYNVTGQLISFAKVSSQESSLALDGFAPGTYFIRIVKENGSETIKFNLK